MNSSTSMEPVNLVLSTCSRNSRNSSDGGWRRLKSITESSTQLRQGEAAQLAKTSQPSLSMSRSLNRPWQRYAASPQRVQEDSLLCLQFSRTPSCTLWCTCGATLRPRQSSSELHRETIKRFGWLTASNSDPVLVWQLSVQECPPKVP